METRKVNKVIHKIAKREGKKENEIRVEMEKAILIGFMNRETRSKWEKMFGKGHLPSPEEFIVKLSDCVAK